MEFQSAEARGTTPTHICSGANPDFNFPIKTSEQDSITLLRLAVVISWYLCKAVLDPYAVSHRFYLSHISGFCMAFF